MRKPKNIHQKVLACGLLLAVCWLCGTPAQGLEIVFKKEVAISKETILLKDIVHFNPVEDATAERLGNLILAAAPAPGESVSLSRQFLQYKIGAAVQAGFVTRIVWPENVVVKRTAQSVSAEQFEEIFKGYIRKNAPWKASEIFFERISTPGTITLPQGRLAIEVQERSGQDFLGNVYLLAQVRVNGKTIRNVSLSGEVLVQKEVIRAARRIDRGTVIGKDDLALALEKIKDLRPGANPRSEEIVGKRATCTIQEGQPLYARMFQEIPLVQKGKRIVIKAENDSIHVTTMGIAQENGQQGDQIKVVNASSGKVIPATVVGPGLVAVRF